METSAVNETGRETDFVSRIMAGDRQAEAELIDSYGRGVRIIIRREGADATIIDDLCQETFRIVLEKIRRGDIREPERLSGFIRSVAKNLVTEHFRRVARRERLTDTEEAVRLLTSSAPNQLERLRFWCNFSREGRLSLFQLLPTRQALLPIPAGSWPSGW
jgi:DNA-directed RNA polymerase specialized sigma24 family protein